MAGSTTRWLPETLLKRKNCFPPGEVLRTVRVRTTGKGQRHDLSPPVIFRGTLEWEQAT